MSMKTPNIASRIFSVLIATLMFLLSASLAWGVVLDHQSRGLVTKGVTVVGHDLSGMTEAQARATVLEAVSVPMLRPVTVAGDNKTWTFDPQGIVVIDVDSMIDSAYSPRRTATLIERLDSQLRGTLLPADIKPVYTVDSAAVAAWVARAATEVDRKPVNSTRKLVKYAFKISPSAKGAKVDRRGAVARISRELSVEAALSSADRLVSLPVGYQTPKVVESSFKTAIIVSLSECRIRLYEGAKLIKSYSCAPGRPGFPTPTGDFKVDSKQRYATWINPGTAWAKSMPAEIPGGPGNPMGTTKIGIDYGGVFMHGVPSGEFGSIGTHASHGCMRMFPSQVLELYGLVRIGDPVFIRE
jgi:lipoprotein-anchoring transpeptidase ErfK/SrfK